MAPENNAVPAVVRAAVAAAQDVRLARQAASFLARSLPEKSREQIVEELLARLHEEKKDREARGLNHWEEHAPRFLERLVARDRARHNREIAGFIGEQHEAALEFTYRILNDWDA